MRVPFRRTILRVAGALLVVHHAAAQIRALPTTPRSCPLCASAARLADFTDIEKTAELTEGGLVVAPNENLRRADALRKMLAPNSKAGANTVPLTDGPDIVDALARSGSR